MPDSKTMLGAKRSLNVLRKLPTIWIVGWGTLFYFWLPRSNQPIFPATTLWFLSSFVITALCHNLGKRLQEHQSTAHQLRQEIDTLKSNLTAQSTELSAENRQLRQDLAESKAAANAHQRQLREVERILNDTDDALCVIDKEYTILHANNALSTLLNLDRDQLIGAKCFHAWQTADCGHDGCPLQRITHGEKKIVSNSLWTKNATGDTKALSITATPFTDEAGNPNGIIKTVRPTATKEIQQMATLDHRWAHDLNNVLAAVIGHTELAIQQSEPGTLLTDNLHKSLRAAQRGQDMIARLPLAGKSPSPATAAPEKMKRQSLPGGRERILIVDDEEILVSMTQQLMNELGYQIDGETSSEAALARFKEDPDYYDLIITDQTMPQLTGSKMAEIMLKIRPELPIILYTGYSEHIDKKRAEKIGIKTLLTKPVPAPTLACTVRSLLDMELPEDALH